MAILSSVNFFSFSCLDMPRFWTHYRGNGDQIGDAKPTFNPRPRINRPRTHRQARAGNLCHFTAANEDFTGLFLI